MGMQFVVVLVGTLVVTHFLALRRMGLVALVGLLSLVPAWQVGSQRPPGVNKENVTNPPIEVGQQQYGSSRSCQTSHSDHCRGWRRSYHRTTTQVATPKFVMGRFNGTEHTALYPKCRPIRQGDDFFMEVEHLDLHPGQSVRPKKPVVMPTWEGS